MSYQLSHTTINIAGYDKNPVVFFNLSINQYLANTCSFNFSMTIPVANGISHYQAYIDFYNKILSQQVQINISEGKDGPSNFKFTGFVFAISCSNNDAAGATFDVSGKGLPAKLDEIEECNSFYRKTIDKIIDKVTTGISIQKKELNTKEPLYFTVQYNQTRFEFCRMLAARYGEWMYYDGTDLVFGKPAGNAVELQVKLDVADVNISAKAIKPSEMHIGFNTYKGEILKKDNNEDAGISHPVLKAGIDAGNKAFNGKQFYTHIGSMLTDSTAFANNMEGLKKRTQVGTIANALLLTARSENNKVNIGSIVDIKDETKASIGQYIVVHINHYCSGEDNYQNNFSALPKEVAMPPYANIYVKPLAKPQPAIVVDNADDKGLGRLKVRFPWQTKKEIADDELPWLSVMVPHAGKNKGFLFLPEKDEQVMVDFIDGNAERPFVVGAFYTDDGKHGNDYTDNNLKVIGTKSGRRLEINDKTGFVKLVDNFEGERPVDGITLKRSENSNFLAIASYKSGDTVSSITLNTNFKGEDKDGIEMISRDAGEKITQIVLDPKNKKISIYSKSSISISSGNIDMNAENISIKASKKLKLTGSEEIDIDSDDKIKMEGTDVKISGNAKMELGGTETKIEGEAKLEVKSSGPNIVSGTPIKLN